MTDKQLHSCTSAHFQLASSGAIAAISLCRWRSYPAVSKTNNAALLALLAQLSEAFRQARATTRHSRLWAKWLVTDYESPARVSIFALPRSSSIPSHCFCHGRFCGARMHGAVSLPKGTPVACRFMFTGFRW